MGIGDLHIARKQTNNQYCKRTETKAVCDDFFEILHPTRLPIVSKKHIGKVVKGRGTIWVARNIETECFTVVRD